MLNVRLDRGKPQQNNPTSQVARLKLESSTPSDTRKGVAKLLQVS
jgi:hypothetical protein